ncbi:MAG: dihydroneopterin aldolase [bacterium]|nr:dihydroneopterin aldolase [bacterium]
MNPKSINHRFKDILCLRGLQFFGRHGTETWEKKTGRRFIVDLELTADFTRAAQGDRLEDALDYRVVYSRAKHVVEAESHDLIERVAWRLLTEMFRTFPVAEVRVRVSKPEAPIGGLNHAVEVEIARTFEEWKETEHAEQTHPQHG